MVFDFDDNFSEIGPLDRGPPRQWVVTCDPAPGGRNKAPRGPGRKKDSRAKPGAAAAPAAPPLRLPLGAEGLDVLDLPPHLAKYGVSRKHEARGAALLGIENDEGRVEFKLRLKDPTPTRFHQLVTQLRFRLSEGDGECFYFIGVEDNGHPRGLPPEELQESLAVLQAMAQEAGATATVLRSPAVEGGQRCAVVRVARRCADEEVDYEDLRIAVAGGVDAGKSTLVAVLTHGCGEAGRPLLDNGRGSARMSVFRHKHEIESGHTSSISQQMLGYDAQGRVINYEGVASYTPAEIASCASKVVRFVDTGGHEKYSKTALAGLTGMLPDYAMVCVCATAGVSWVTREHLAVALALGVRPFVVLTKADLAGDEALLDSLVEDIRCLVGAAVGEEVAGPASPLGDLGSDDSCAPWLAAATPVVESEAEARQLAPRMLRSRVGAPGGGLLVPIFKVSSVSGRGLPALHAFMQALPPEIASLVGPWGAAGLAGPLEEEGDEEEEGSGGSGYAAAAAAAAAVALAGRLGELSIADCGSGAAAELSQGWHHAGRSAAPAAAGGDGGSGSGEAAGGAGAGPGASVPVHLQIDHGFFVAGVGPVYSGRVVSGTVRIGSQLLLGPCLEEGSTASADATAAAGSAGAGAGSGFLRVTVTGLHRSQVPVSCASQGQIATVAVEVEGPQQGGLGQRGQGSSSGPATGPRTDATAAAAAAGARPAAHPPPAAGPALAAASAAGLSSAGSAPHLAGTCWDLSDHIEGGASPAAAGPLLGAGYCRQRPSVPKGLVLLEPSLCPVPCWEFDAALVLLGGQWPARGLMSGRWPPEEEAELQADSLPTGSLQSRGSAKRGPSVYTAVVHCGGIRQAAQVMSIEELPLESPFASLPPSPPHPLSCEAGRREPAPSAVVGPQILPALVAARLLKATGWVPSAAGFSVGSQGSLPRLDSGPSWGQRSAGAGSPCGREAGWGGAGSPATQSAGEWGGRSRSLSRPACGWGLPRPGSGKGGGQGLLHISPSGGRLAEAAGCTGAGLEEPLGDLSSTWSGESDRLSTESSESYSDSGSASDGGRGGSGRGVRVGWADGAGGERSSRQLQEGGGSAGAPSLHPQRQPEGGNMKAAPLLLQRQPSSAAAGRRPLVRHPSLAAARHDPDLGCLARVRLRFVRRPEWLVPGARLVVRDRGSGRAAAVGYVLAAGAPATGAAAGLTCAL